MDGRVYYLDFFGDGGICFFSFWDCELLRFYGCVFLWELFRFYVGLCFFLGIVLIIDGCRDMKVWFFCFDMRYF